MPDYLDGLTGQPRLLFEVPLKPLQGSRFQPTGFPDLGAALYESPSGDELLVESAQSMANRLEAVCWDPATETVLPSLQGISYIRVERDGEFLTSSILESHRINSPYILEGGDQQFFARLQEETNALQEKAIDLRLLARILMRYDCNCLLHGAFLAKKELAGGRLRIARAVSAFIDATGVRVATSGGVKKDQVDPSGDTKKGFGHVPFSRDEYTADAITAYFNIDLAQVRAYALGQAAEDLLVTLGLYKVLRFLREGLRLRTACDLEMADGISVSRPAGWTMPSLDTVEAALPGLIQAVTAEGLFAQPPVTTVTYIPPPKKSEKGSETGDGEDEKGE